MKQKKLYFNEVIFGSSLVLYLFTNIFKELTINCFGNYFALFLLVVANFLLLIVILKNKVIYKNNLDFSFACILIFIPCLYKNAYLSDNLYSYFLYYFLSILYAVLASFIKFDEKFVKLVFKAFILFAICTSIFSWYSLVFPDSYISIISKIMPKSLTSEIFLNFKYYKNIMGLTSHYSKNAFYILLGIICNLYFIIKNKRISKISLMVELFLLITMLVIGKRGHILFLIISASLCYFIYNKSSLKTFIRFFTIVMFTIIIYVILMQFIPEVSNTVNRFFYNTNGDYSNGRIDMYNDAYKLYKENNYNPIGWGQYAKSTNYTHPGLHNDYIQLFYEVGVFGLIIVISSNIYILKKSIKKLQVEKSSTSIIIFLYNSFFLMYSLTGLPHYDFEAYMFYFLINIFLCCRINKGEIGYEK